MSRHVPFLRVLAPVLALLVAAPAAAEPGALERAAFQAAHAAATRGPPGRWQALASGLHDYPLYPYLEAAALERDLPHARAAEIQAFLARHAGAPFAEDLRTRWLRDRAAKRRWPEFLAAWRERSDPALRCAHVTARIATGANERLRELAQEAWLAPKSLPAACDAVAAWLLARGALDDALRWRRIELAAEAREAALVRALARDLSPATRGDGERWAVVIGNPGVELAKVAGFPADARSRKLAALAFAQLARRDHKRAAALWPLLDRYLATDVDARGRAIAALALWKAANYEPDAAAWLAKVPDSAGDDALREWRVRVHLARSDYPAALKATALLSATQQLDSRWRWLRARLLEETGETGASQAVLESLANEPNYHGFLAAERRARPYSLCPLEASRDPALRAQVAAIPAIARAFELREIGWEAPARREWDAAFATLAGERRYVAVALALERGWLDRGPLSLLAPADARYYALRFPLGHAEELTRHARRNGLAPAWVAGLIRSESAWMADARSHADARGLMQVLPSTAKKLAVTERVRYTAPADLYRPAINLPLGTRFLADMLRRYRGREWLATAAYNAGPAPVDRWLAQRPALPTDFWIETIPYRETREYVSRVMAFSVIYEWRSRGGAGSLAQRLALATRAKGDDTRAVACALTAAAPAPVAGR